VAEIFGRQVAENVLPVSGAEDDLRIKGLLGRPGTGRGTRHEMITFVNGRPVENRTLAFGILESYHTLIPKGRYPVAFLFLSIDPVGVDVNVHPSKREIRFRDEARVRGFTIRTILDCLRRDRPAEAVAPCHPPSGPESFHHSDGEETASVSSAPPVPASGSEEDSPGVDGNGAAMETETTPRADPESTPEQNPVPDSVQGWMFLGVLQGTYCLFETGQGLVLLDRRAAEQRIWYERLLRDFRSGEVAGQRLLFAVPLELDSIGSAILLDHLDFFGSHGFEIARFGRNFFRIEEVPVWLEPKEVEMFVRDLVGLIRQGRLSGRKPDLAGEALARAAALRLAGRSWKPDEEAISILVETLFSCEVPSSSPAGRPTYIELDASELNRRFHKGIVAREEDPFLRH
jgi:DNA mismatch repair protein MutL